MSNNNNNNRTHSAAKQNDTNDGFRDTSISDLHKLKPLRVKALLRAVISG